MVLGPSAQAFIKGSVMTFYEKYALALVLLFICCCAIRVYFDIRKLPIEEPETDKPSLPELFPLEQAPCGEEAERTQEHGALRRTEDNQS